MINVVITGGARFIGNHLAIELRRRGFDVVAVDNLEKAKAVDVLEAEGVPLVRADVRTDELPRGDVYIHAAAYIDVEESWHIPFEYAINNAAAAVVIRHPKNMGYGAAIKTLLRAALAADAEYAVQLTYGPDTSTEIPTHRLSIIWTIMWTALTYNPAKTLMLGSTGLSVSVATLTYILFYLQHNATLGLNLHNYLASNNNCTILVTMAINTLILNHQKGYLKTIYKY